MTTPITCSEPYDRIEKEGLPSEKCVSYKSGKGDCPTCPTKCDDGSELVMYKIMKPNTTRVLPDAESAMLDIYTNGYIAAGLDVYSDLMTYKVNCSNVITILGWCLPTQGWSTIVWLTWYSCQWLGYHSRRHSILDFGQYLVCC